MNEMVVLAGDMNRHVGSSNVGYDEMHGGFGYGDGNARILKFADGLNLVICNTLFMKQESLLVTYAAGSVKSTVDYIIVRQEDKAIQCTSCQKCVDRKCSGIKGSMYKVMKSFVCRGCVNVVTGTECTSVDILSMQIWS